MALLLGTFQDAATLATGALGGGYGLSLVSAI
jgi:hypothetical protein